MAKYDIVSQRLTGYYIRDHNHAFINMSDAELKVALSARNNPSSPVSGPGQDMVSKSEKGSELM